MDGSFGVIGATSNVVGFKDKPDEGSGFWFSYGDLAPMQDGVDYVMSVWVKVESDSDFKIQPYTCDNTETQRQYLDLKSVKPTDGWANHSWAFTGRACDSMSFRYYGLKAGKVWLAAPKLKRGTSITVVLVEHRVPDGCTAASKSVPCQASMHMRTRVFYVLCSLAPR